MEEENASVKNVSEKVIGIDIPKIKDLFSVLGEREMNSVDKLFNLFRLDRLLKTAEEVEEEELIRLSGGSLKADCFERIDDEYRKQHPLLLYPERCYRLYGTDFDIDVYDRGNGWYLVIKFKVNP